MPDRSRDQGSREAGIDPAQAASGSGIVFRAQPVEHAPLIVRAVPVDDHDSRKLHALEQRIQRGTDDEAEYLLGDVRALHGIGGKIHPLHVVRGREPQGRERLGPALPLGAHEQGREVGAFQVPRNPAGKGMGEQAVAAHGKVRSVPLDGRQGQDCKARPGAGSGDLVREKKGHVPVAVVDGPAGIGHGWASSW